MTKAEVAALAQKYLDAAEYIENDIYFVADEEHTQIGDGWYRVPVRPSRWPHKSYLFYGFLAEVNEELMDKEKINILFMTGEPLVEEPELVAA